MRRGAESVSGSVVDALDAAADGRLDEADDHLAASLVAVDAVRDLEESAPALTVWIDTADAMIGAVQELVDAVRTGDAERADAAQADFDAAAEGAAQADRALRIGLGETGNAISAVAAPAPGGGPRRARRAGGRGDRGSDRGGRMSDGPALVGRTLADRYRIEAELARGGMANVYRARDLRLDRDVAVKVLAARYADDPAFTARFLDEARAAASLSHPSLVHVYDSGSDGSSHYIVMELLDRHRTLRDRLAAEGPLPPDEVLGIGRELLGGLRVVHDRGLVHCDVTPANVMLGPGPAKLIDFGIASRPHDGNDDDTSIGSLRFMSPEQLHGEALTPASDLFSLGAVLYDALTGRPPYAGETPEEISAAHAAGGVRPPSTLVDGVPGRLDEAILQALRRDPDARFTSADAMEASLAASAGDVESAGDDDTTQVVRVPPPPPPGGGGLRAPRRLLPRRRPVVPRRARRGRLVAGTRGLRSGRSSSSVPRRWSSCSWSCPSSNSVARAGEAGPRRRPHPPESPARM